MPYYEHLRLMREDWGIISGEECEEVERAIQKLQLLTIQHGYAGKVAASSHFSIFFCISRGGSP